MLITTTENVPGCHYQVLGEVFGVTTQSRSAFGNFTANIKRNFGGEIKSYTKMMETARQQAIQRMCDQADKLGANAVIMMRFDSGSLSDDLQSVVAYGTAVLMVRD